MWYNTISSVISSSIFLSFILPFLFFFITYNPFHLYIWISLCGMTILSEGLKYSVCYESKRPEGARDCNLCANDGDQTGQPGMPSTHSTLAAFFSTTYVFYTNNPILRIMCIMYAIMIMVSRYIMRCHTPLQIAMGALLGTGCSYLYGILYA